MKKIPTTHSFEGQISADGSGNLADISDFVRLSSQAAFEPLGKLAGGGNQREDQRRHYPFEQRIAPILGDTMPADRQFREVPFFDISATGASFLWAGDVAFDRLVVELGTGDNVSRVLAQVVWLERLETTAPASPVFRVGCSF